MCSKVFSSECVTLLQSCGRAVVCNSLLKLISLVCLCANAGTKLAQAAIFNNPGNACKVLVATDAIGMGLNL